MKTLSSLIPVIENPLEIYKYDKVILNESFQSDGSLWSYLRKIFVNYDKQSLKSFKYFIKICKNIEFQFKNMYNNTIIVCINYIIHENNKNNKNYKNYKKILIYLINKYKNLEIYSFSRENILFYLNPLTNNDYSKLSFELYKYYKLYH